MVIVEAFAAGCGVISTTVGAIPEIVSSDGGILVDPGDDEALKEAVIALLSSKKRRQSFMKHNANISCEYTISMFAKKVVSACEEIV